MSSPTVDETGRETKKRCDGRLMTKKERKENAIRLFTCSFVLGLDNLVKKNFASLSALKVEVRMAGLARDIRQPSTTSRLSNFFIV
jgi:hypothetical protein